MTKEVISYTTSGTCCKLMNIELDGDTIKNVEFIGGCNGNLQGIRNLVKGMKLDEVVAKLKGIKCGTKPTSCPDQLAQCLAAVLEEKKKTAAV